MRIYPAIDLFNGKCVRLRQGDFAQSTVYSEDPIQTLQGFEDEGAKDLHLVDLSGAKDPAQRQLKLISRLVTSSFVKVQVGGGIRTFQEAQALLEIGADRVVIGSAAISDPELVKGLLGEFGGTRITVALDARVDARGVPTVATQGWQEQSAVSLEEAIEPFLAAGLERVLCTDIARDGMMSGPNTQLYVSLSKLFPRIEFQASGGIGKLEDLKALSTAGIRSAIVGRAIYEGAIQLREAIRQC